MASNQDPKRQGDIPVQGAAIAAAIMKRLPAAQRTRVLEAMATQAPTVVAKVEEALFNFSGITKLNSQGLTTVLQVAPASDIALSAQGASQELRTHLLKHLPQERLASVKAEMTQRPSIDPAQIEEAQRRLMKLIDELEGAGKIAQTTKSGRYA